MHVAQAATRAVASIVLTFAFAASATGGATALTQGHVDPSRVAVGYEPASAAEVRAYEGVLGASLLASLPEIDADVVHVDPARGASILASLRAFPGVRYAQLDGRAYAAATPNDELWPQEWSPVRTDAPPAWDRTTGSRSVVVAIVDTGVDSAQPDLVGRVLNGYDFVNDDADASDDDGHGTAVAGIVAAAGNNGVGVAGYCWECRILPVKVLGSDGSGFNSWVAAGIVWAVDHGASVINASLGSLSDDLTLAAAAQYAAAHDVLLVAAAGNESSALLDYPAALPSVLSVSASDPDDQPYSFSNTGAALAAPGENVTTGLDAGYVSFVGTSSAAPVVSGAAALALSLAPDATPAQVTQALETTAAPSPGSRYGRVDVYAALNVLAPQPTPNRQPTGVPSPSSAAPARGASTSSVTLDVRGNVTARRPRRSYVVRTGSGQLVATLDARNGGRVPLVLRVVTPDGSTIGAQRGRRHIRLAASVDPLTYRVVVSRRGAGRPVAYRLSLVYPRP